MAEIRLLYVPWWRRRELWQHDHNDPLAREWKAEKTFTVGKLKRVCAGQFQAQCSSCSTMFVAEANHHIIYPPVEALGLV